MCHPEDVLRRMILREVQVQQHTTTVLLSNTIALFLKEQDGSPS
jgi:hypothetical protein